MDIKLQPNITGTNVNLVKGATQADLTNAVNNAKTYRDEAQAFSILSEDKSIESAYSALNASVSATTAIDKANIATNKATEANNSAINASASEAVCIAKATIATDKADIATAQSVIATDKANEASVSANTATTQAGIATTKASEASTSASNALTSENNADTSEANALIYRNQAESFANSINPSDLVHISGTETITGNKTFSGTVNGLTKATVGLSNVDNTSDSNKPVSAATQTALNTKVDKVTSTDNAIVRFDGTTGNLQNSTVTISDNGTITFPAGARITGDFSNATPNNRIAFQTSTINDNTIVTAKPNGAGTQGMFLCESTSDANNCQTMNIHASTLDTKIVSAARGTAAYVPMLFVTGGAERMRIDTNGNVGIGTTSINNKLEVNGSIGFGSTTGNGRIYSDVNLGCLLQSDVSSPAVAEFAFLNNAGSHLAIINTSGSLLLKSGTGGLGYGTGAGGQVTQLTNKSTAVTLNTPTGEINMSSSALAGGASVTFTVNNSLVSLIDTVVVTYDSWSVGGTGRYSVRAETVNGSVFITLTNTTASSLSEPVRLHFAIIKGANS